MVASFLHFHGCTPNRRYGVWHEVKHGQTLWRIAKTYGVDLYELAEVNGIEDPARIRAGTKLFIPGADKVMHVEPYKPGSSNRPYVRHHAASGNGKVTENNGTQGTPGISVRLAWPVKGVLTSLFGRRAGRRHDGIDIGAPPGTPVKAALDGEVVYANYTGGYGNLLIIRHDDRLLTVYAHLQGFAVSKGQHVRKGQVIGKVGTTGRSSGPHLHFEVRLDREPRDPLLFLPRRR